MMAMTEADIKSGQAEEETVFKKEENVRVSLCSHVPHCEGYLLNFLAALYLHGVCLSWGSLPIGKDSPIVSAQYIWSEEEETKAR